MDLILAEKDIAARRIANILSNGNVRTRRINGVRVYEFDGKIVMGLRGHIVGVDFPQEYSSWNLDLRKLIKVDPIRVPVQRKYIDALKSMAENVSNVVVATDYDREGELIGVEALDIIREKNPSVGIARARYSALTPADVRNAFSNLTSVDYNLASACDARQIIDLIWGASLTRFVSLVSGKVGSEFLSVGRVQSPTLALLVRREKEIRSFVPERFWELIIDFGNFSARCPHRFSTREEAMRVLNSLPDRGKVVEVNSSVDKRYPPCPFNTTEFLRSAAMLGFSVGNAMQIAEWLYVNGYISYPRTDNTVYPKLDFRKLLRMFIGTEFEEHASKLLEKEKLIPTRGGKVATDHPPIYPVGVARRDEMTRDRFAIYELVVRRFLATLSDPLILESKKVKIMVGEWEFFAEGSKILQAGWSSVYPYVKIEEKELPELNAGDLLKVERRKLLEDRTKPPPRYTQATLIKEMEDLGLGTKSTRHEIITKLYSRAYVYGRQMRPTERAKAVIDVLERYVPEITKPDMTRMIESEMDAIAAGKKSKQDVIELSREMLDNVFAKLMRDIEMVSAELRQRIEMGETIGKCPNCGKKLLIRKSQRGLRFVGCESYPSCDFSLPLPKDGDIQILDRKCKKHGMNLLKIHHRGKSWYFGCAYCNFIKWKGEKELGGGNEDLHHDKGKGRTGQKGV